MSRWPYDVVILAPERDAEFAEAAASAGALCVVLEDLVRARTAPVTGGGGFGMLVQNKADLETIPRFVDALVLEDASLLQGRDRLQAVAVRSRHEADRAIAALADALIVRSGAESAFILAQRLRSTTSIPILLEHGAGEAACAATRVLGAFGVVASWPDGLASRLEVRNAVRRMRTAPALCARQASNARILGPDSAFATKYAVRFPIVQGPMTRVSDGADFAIEVARSGGIPSLALGVANAKEAESALAQTRRSVSNPWAAGILGFLDEAILRPQLDAVLAAKPRIAVVAGTNADVALELEAGGIAAFMHLPAPRLLPTFLKSGVRRFVFEGNECGGHVGPKSSLALWDAAVAALLSIGDGVRGIDILAAGGIHDAVSAAAAAAIFAPVAERGATLGLLMGTAYLFTREAVATRAITPIFQRNALECERTALLESGPGHVVRVAATGWADQFRLERSRLLAEGSPSDIVQHELESLALGRLRLAAKGTTRVGDAMEPASPAVQQADGAFMMGEVATLQTHVRSIEQLHRDVTLGGEELLNQQGVEEIADMDIAVVGMSCILPDAARITEYWQNVLRNDSCIREVPRGRWDVREHHEIGGAPWKTPSKWGAFIPEIEFDPAAFGIVPKSLRAIEPAQILSLIVADSALRDAGLQLSPSERQRTSVVFGVDGGGELATAFSVRANLGDPACNGPLPVWSEDAFPGMLGNVVAGRVANRLDLGGPNYTVDAACASGLAAVHSACGELRSGRVDHAVAGAVDVHNALKDYLLFASVQALSPTGSCKAFSRDADGIVLGEGAGAVVLKRRRDAVRDGDRIYAVIRAIGASSDGRAASLTAPSQEGQLRCLREAYAQGSWRDKVGLLEAHGTGTVVGDQVELGVLSEFFGSDRMSRVTLGSVKTQIGHTKCAAGIASFIKASLAVSYGILPPQRAIEPSGDAHPFAFRTVPAPWPHAERVAGISAFGFGGTNFHCVLSNHTDATPAPDSDWPCELFLLRGKTRQDAWRDAVLFREAAERPGMRLVEFSRLVADHSPEDPVQYAFVAASVRELGRALDRVPGLGTGLGEVYASQPRDAGAVAVLFPGQGSQHVGMWRELLCFWPSWRDHVSDGVETIEHMFPPEGTRLTSRQRDLTLRQTLYAQRSLGVTSLAVGSFLDALGLKADFCAGHSYGELAALAYADAFPRTDLIRLSTARAWSMHEHEEDGGMLAVFSDASSVRSFIGDTEALWIATRTHHTRPCFLAASALLLRSKRRSSRWEWVVDC